MLKGASATLAMPSLGWGLFRVLTKHGVGVRVFCSIILEQNDDKEQRKISKTLARGIGTVTAQVDIGPTRN